MIEAITVRLDDAMREIDDEDLDELRQKASKSSNPTEAVRLYALMSDISEDCWCSGWMSDNEFALWSMLDIPGPSAYGQGVITPLDKLALVAAHKSAGGWWSWMQLDPPRFLLTSEWEARFASYEKAFGRVKP